MTPYFKLAIGMCIIALLVGYWKNAEAIEIPDGTLFIEGGTGYNFNAYGCTDECWNDEGAEFLGAYMRGGYEWKYVGVHYIHLSQWFEAQPFRSGEESSVDHIGIYLRYEF